MLFNLPILWPGKNMVKDYQFSTFGILRVNYPDSDSNQPGTFLMLISTEQEFQLLIKAKILKNYDFAWL